MIQQHLFTLFLLTVGVLSPEQIDKFDFEKLFAAHPEYISDGFDFPVGPPNSKGYYNAQVFGQNDHLGDDWNGTGGGNTDLGDPIYSIANGYVSSAEHHGPGWGKVVRIVHFIKDKNQYVESLYAHCDMMKVKQGDWVKRGVQIGTIGNADGRYLAHLHLEIRTTVDMGLGGGYSKETTGFADPTKFIKANRPKP